VTLNVVILNVESESLFLKIHGE